MQKNEKTIEYYRYRATLPVAGMDGPLAAPEQVSMVILAACHRDAKQQAAEAGLVLIGQIDTAGNLMEEPKP